MPDNDRVLLIGFHPEDGRMVLARSNPDNARYVVVTIPGVGGLGRHPERAENLFRKIARDPDDEDVSVITWGDYVAPRSAAEARDPAFAVTAVPQLVSFLVDLRMTAEHYGRWHRPARITVVAHGYGGLVAGFAARDSGLDADALVLLGCAAAGVETADELRVAGPVYATSPDVGGDGTPLGVHGPRPDSPGFGAMVLRPGPLSSDGDPVARYLPSLRKIILAEA
jgi:hypothetical protein